ncbi:MAG: hypothetical protein Q9222_006468, partial [Ikaeria aurantiellina]
MFAQISHGYGRHIYLYGPREGLIKTRLWLRTLYVFEPMYHTSTTFAKYSMYVIALESRGGLPGNYINGGIWAETEPSVAVICACLPSLRPLFAIASRGLTHMSSLKSKISHTSTNRKSAVS